MPVPVLLTLGYEGRTAEDVVDKLRSEQAAVLVDVRQTPMSRKPGLSKRQLSERLQRAGIEYRHIPSLGVPKENRAAFRANDPAAIDKFEDLLHTPDGTAGLQEVEQLVEHATVALLCFERDWQHCHRKLVADRLRELRPELNVRHI